MIYFDGGGISVCSVSFFGCSVIVATSGLVIGDYYSMTTVVLSSLVISGFSSWIIYSFWISFYSCIYMALTSISLYFLVYSDAAGYYYFFNWEIDSIISTSLRTGISSIFSSWRDNENGVGKLKFFAAFLELLVIFFGFFTSGFNNDMELISSSSSSIFGSGIFGYLMG